MNKVATLIIGFVLGGLVVGGAIYLSDSQDDSTSGPIEQSPTMTVATPVTEADELRIDGLGSMTIGMRVNDVDRATGMEVDISSDFGPQCRYGQLVGGPRDPLPDVQPTRVGTDRRRDRVGDRNRYGDRSGGSHLGSRRRLRRWARTPAPSLSGDRGSYLIFNPEPEDGFLIIFETNRRSVTSFRSGFDEQVRYIEGCA